MGGTENPFDCFTLELVRTSERGMMIDSVGVTRQCGKGQKKLEARADPERPEWYAFSARYVNSLLHA